MKRIFPFISIIIGLAMLMAACGSLPELPPTRTTEESGDTAVDTTEAAPPTQDEPAAATDTQNSQPEPTAEPSTNSGGESSASSDTTDTVQAVSASSGNGAAIKAVDLLEAWVNAGASEQDAFDYVGFDGNTYQGSFETDVLPLFTTKGIWYDGSRSCDSCHFANSAASAHEMDLSSYEGIMTGGDALSDPPGVPLLGQSEFGDTDYNWGDSKLRGRLRNNRMPPGWEFDITEGNRDGYCVEVTDAGVNVLFGEYGCELNAVGLIGAWVDAGAPETDSFSFGGGDLNFERDVQPFFTENEMWYEGSQACGGCHFANSENSYHEMDLSTYEGMMSGGDVLSEPPGVPIFGQSEVGATDFNWGESKLRARLRNNRMPPGWEFDITEGNRDGPWVLHGERVDVSELASADTAGNDLGSISFTTTTARTMTTITTTTIVQPDGTVETTSVTQVVVFDGEGNTTTATGGEGAFFGTGECQVKAVDLIGAWVDSGAPETDSFSFTSLNDEACSGDFANDVQPLFTENNAWYEGSQACASCHFANSENSYHEMDLSTYEGMMSGGDVLSDPPGVPIFGQSEVGATDFNWGESKLRARLRNNRMPPGWEFDITEGNRDGPTLTVNGVDVAAVDLIGAWVDAGAPETDAFGEYNATFTDNVLPLFTENNAWYEGSQACASCHFANSENSYHEMDLSSYEGIMAGGDVLSEPPGVPILGQSEFGATDYNWGDSKLRARLRNNRMPPGWEFDITEENRDGPIILAGTKQ